MRLLFLIPNGGRVHTGFFKSMIGVTQALQNRRIPFAIKTYEFSDIMISRNYLMSYFLSQEMFTHALTLDTDLEFSFTQLERLIDFGEDFSCALYPDRRLPYRAIKSGIEGDGNVEDDLAAGSKYIKTHGLGGDDHFTQQQRGEFITVASAGAGFMLISRNVVETMADEGIARPLPRQGKLSIYRDAPRFYDFFSHHLTSEEDAFYGEDQSFCRRWIIGCGGHVWADLRSKLRHIGEFSFPGDFSQTDLASNLLADMPSKDNED